jgi:hypothetical protein
MTHRDEYGQPVDHSSVHRARPADDQTAATHPRLRLGLAIGRLVRAVGSAYVVYVVLLVGLSGALNIAWGYGIGSPLRLLRAIPGLLWFAAMLFTAGLVLTLPVWGALWLARRRLDRVAAGIVGAVVLLAWGEWSTYRMEWFDVWRHGNPGLRYWMTTVVPTGVAWAAAGAVLGSAIGGRDRRRKRPTQPVASACVGPTL